MYLRIIHSVHETEVCTGDPDRLVDVAASAIAPHVPAGVAGPSTYAEVCARAALRDGACTLPGVRLEITEEAA